MLSSCACAHSAVVSVDDISVYNSLAVVYFLTFRTVVPAQNEPHAWHFLFFLFPQGLLELPTQAALLLKEGAGHLPKAFGSAAVQIGPKSNGGLVHKDLGGNPKQFSGKSTIY
ncbi:hypothetical protein Pelo_7906 [Pelomyxa schiedti]|nr:hypothetical protein Pelo_7906 [Pelomyxa schiedti]